MEVKERAWGVVKGKYGILSFLLCCVGRGGEGEGERGVVCGILLRLHEILCEDVFGNFSGESSSSSSPLDISRHENRVKVLQGFQDQLVRVIDQYIREGYTTNNNHNNENSSMEAVVYELLLSVMKWSKHTPPSLSSSPSSPSLSPSLPPHSLSLSPSLSSSLPPTLSPSSFFNAPVYIQLWAKANYLLRCLSASFFLPSSSSPSFRVVVEEIYKLVHQEKLF